MKDELLIGGLERRDKVVFDYLFNHYYSTLCAFSMQYLNDKSAVEDLVQEFFVSLWMDAPKHQIHSSLKTYLFASVKNRCLDYRKHLKVVRKYKSYLLISSSEKDNLSDHLFAESELRHAIQLSVEKLAPGCREIFEMNRLNGLIN